MDLRDHFQLTGNALKNWIVAQLQDSLAVGLLWMIGLFIIGVPWAPLWALLAATLQFIPHIGPVLGLIGPALAATLRWGDWEHPPRGFGALRDYRDDRRLPAAALPHEARRQSADVGFHPDPLGAWYPDSFLGRAAVGPAAGRCLRLPGKGRKPVTSQRLPAKDGLPACYNFISPACVSRQSRDLLYGRVLLY